LANITSDPASPAPAASAPKVHRSIQNYIGEAETFITTVKTDAEINPVMDLHGYDAAELATADGLLQTAAAAFGVRLAGIGGKTEKHEELMTGEAQVRGDYAAFRSVARAAFPA
jgi:hypothetical protein